ncbi:MAG: DNA-binding protein WhiA [Oscillospiraceae bacterium]|nr:DNA-binding protein WhiA [Oscillospiraceae bacterium]
MSYSNKVKELLSEKKDKKKCCKEAFSGGFFANAKNLGENVPNQNIFLCSNCKKSFMRGLFLSVGSISDPKDTYHLEISISSGDLAYGIKEMAELENIFFKYVKRRNRHILYLKSSEQIEDFMYFIHAEKISFDLMETKIIKEVRNNANRVTNFESANLDKISKASARQIEAAKHIIRKGGFESMPEELKQTARLRLKHIELSIREIGEISNPPISKSGILHRMQKIMNIAKDLQ